MANPEHLEIIKRGKEAIRAWRREHPSERLDFGSADPRQDNLGEAILVRADLRGANLRGADLSGANLRGADLSRSDLREADLREIDLRFANIGGADLSEADLRRADLTFANLIMTNLNKTNLSEADICGTNFLGAALHGTNFHFANLNATVFSDCDISGSKNLKTVSHDGPSTVGIDTLLKSGGNIPEEFLWGAGVPEIFITYARSLIGQPIEFYTCFISYASADQPFANRLYADLRAKNVRCWYWPESAVWGRRIWEDIDRSIRVYDKLIVICSKSSLNNPNVLEEIERAINKEKAIAVENERRKEEALKKGEVPILKDADVLFPVRVDDYVLKGWDHYLKDPVISRNVGDFSGWDRDAGEYQRSLQRLLSSLDPKSWPILENLKPSP